MSSNDISTILEALRGMREDHENVHADLSERIDKIYEEVKPVAEIYRDMNGTGRIIKWVFGVLTGIGAFILLVRSVLTLKS